MGILAITAFYIAFGPKFSTKNSLTEGFVFIVLYCMIFYPVLFALALLETPEELIQYVSFLIAAPISLFLVKFIFGSENNTENHSSSISEEEVSEEVEMEEDFAKIRAMQIASFKDDLIGMETTDLHFNKNIQNAKS